MKKDILKETLFLKKTKQKVLENRFIWKFIRINTSNAKNGYDLDCDVGNIEAFIDEFKNKKIRKLEDKIKELEDKNKTQQSTKLLIILKK